MWTALWVSLTATILTLRSMRALLLSPYQEKASVQPIMHTSYLVIAKEELPIIIDTIVRQLHTSKVEVALEVLYLPNQREIVLYLPSTISLPADIMTKLIPVQSIWSENYNPEFIIDESEAIYNTPLAHQIILKSKTHNLAFVTTRGVKKTPPNYLISGLDEYKWKQFMQKKTDTNPDLITHDRIYPLIYEKLVSY